MTAEGGVLTRNGDYTMFLTVRNIQYCFLGLTVACAKCHDHKFDPISQKITIS